MKAFKFEDCSTDTAGIVFDKSASKARYSVYLSARDVGYSSEFKDIKTLRAPEFDKAQLVGGHEVKAGVCYGEEYLEVKALSSLEAA